MNPFNMPISFYKHREPMDDDSTIEHNYIEADCALETEISHHFCNTVCMWWNHEPDFFPQYAHAAIMTLKCTDQEQEEVEEELGFLRDVLNWRSK